LKRNMAIRLGEKDFLAICFGGYKRFVITFKIDR
jgi:hypothetical protein